MVAVMLGTCTGARNKLCASFRGEGAAAGSRHQPPAPTISLPSSRANFATVAPRRTSRGWESAAAGVQCAAVATMDTDQKECLRRESASLSPQGSASALSPYFDNPTSPISPGGSRRGEPKQCGVCGDVAKSNHFGGRSCDSCKAFFRRSVQNNAYRGFNCPYEKKCVIAKTSRKACQFCRFEKCLAIGMEKSWVMSEAERRKMMEQRQERKVAAALQQQQQQIPQQLQQQSQQLVPVASCSVRSTVENTNSFEEFVLSDEVKSEIEHIEEYYKQSYKANPYSSDMTSVKGSRGVLETWMQFCKKIGHFFSLFEDFSSLCQEDQAVLLQTAMTSAGIIMGSVTYESWIGKRKAGGTAGPSIPKLSFDNIEKLVPGDLLYRVKTFFKKFQQICPDETMAKILMLVSLYSPEMTGLKDERKVQKLQEHYINILSCYLKYKFSAEAGRMFANALVSLADVRELAERSLALEIKHSAVSQLAAASSDSSSGGNSSARRGSGGGGLEGPGMGEGGGGSGGTGGCSNSSGGTSSSDGTSNRDVDGVDGPSPGPNSSNCLGLAVNTPLRFGRPSLDHSEFYPRSSGLGVVDSNNSYRPSHLSSQRISSTNKDRLTQRELSQLRIQKIISTIPLPAIVKIIYHMSEDLDIEAKKTDGGIKFLRKSRSGAHVSSTCKASNPLKQHFSNIEIKKEYAPILEDCQHPSFPETFIKEEKMDLDSEDIVDFDVIKMLTKDIDTSNHNVDHMSENISLPSQRHSFGNNDSDFGENSHNSQDHLFSQSRSAMHHLDQEQGHLLRQSSLHVQPSLSRNAFDRMGGSPLNSVHNSGNSLVPRRSMSPLNFPPATVSAEITMNGPPHATGAYDSSLALVPSSRSGDSAHYRNGDGCPSPQLPFSNNFSSTQDRTSDKSPSFPSGSFLNCAPSTAQALSSRASAAVSSITGNGHNSVNHSITSRDDSQFSPLSSSLPLTSCDSNSFSSFEDGYHFSQTSHARSSNSFSYSDDKESSFQQPLCHSSVQRQIMSMSINSPSSPSDSNFTVTSNNDKLVGHIRSHVTRLSPSSASFMPSSQSSPQTAELPDRLPSCSPNKDYITMKMEASFASADGQCSTPFPPCSPATPSPSPSVSSLRSSSSNSSCENSSDVFERSLYTSPLNLSGLSDVEFSVLQKFFEHISEHLMLHRSEGKPWNSDDLLPKPFLEMLQAELESEQQK